MSDKAPAIFSLLIVEDDHTARKAMVRMISRKFPGCTVYAAGNGVQGVELFRHFTPDIVMTDINMPVMDGVEMIRATRLIKHRTAYIVLTAYSDKRSLQRVDNLDVTACLIKPLSFRQLFDAIEKCTAGLAQQDGVPD